MIQTTSTFHGEGPVLMCKNRPVYDIELEKVLDIKRVPGLLLRNNVFCDWFDLRKSSPNNGSAREIKNTIYKDVSDKTASIMNHALSLSDCYWIKRKEENISFESISPYYDAYWDSDINDPLTAKPNLFVNGFKNKKWENRIWLRKDTDSKETDAVSFCMHLNIPVNDYITDLTHIYFQNFTNADVMLESCDMSGVITEESICTELILKTFGIHGFTMILVDAIVGNGDRHSGNFGYLRDANSGAYLGFSPLYDFDHALDSSNVSDLMLDEIIYLCKTDEAYRTTALEYLNKAITFKGNETFVSRSKFLRKQLK